jgi:hypothetical protein
MASLIKQLAICGQGIGKKAVSQIFTQALKDWSTCSNSLFSNSTLDRFIRKYELECKNVKNIDPARIAQVTPANRDAFFFRLDQIVALIHSLDPINCPWKTWKEVNSNNIDNMDEMGTDGTRFREMMLIPKDVTQRIFQSTPEGDRAHTHISLCVFSKSNGRYKDDSAGIEGAPMPLVIHTKSLSKDKGKSALEKRIGLYKPDEFIDVPSAFSEGISNDNPLGITIRTSNSGSMTKELFLDAMLHYVKSLGSDQGENGKYVFLLLDSHVSRWNPIALWILFRNRVVPIFFPSHLSIVVQPQDNGVILFLHKCIEEASLLQRLFQTETNIAYVNRILEAGFHLFRDGERKKLIDHGSNSTTRAYKVPGIIPRNPFSSGWRENLELYASFNDLRISNSNPSPYYGVRPKDELLCPSFSDEERSLLNKAVPILARGNSEDVPCLLDEPKTKCYAIANEIVNDWVEKAPDERALRPRATNAVQRIALKHMTITHILTANPKASDSALLDDNFKEAKRAAILNLALPMETIEARPNEIKEGNWFKVTKMTRPTDMWNVFDGEKTRQVSTIELDKEWIINLEFDMFPNDKKLRSKRQRSHRRRRFEKDRLLHRMAKTIAEEERLAKLKFDYDEFMSKPKNKQSFADFKGIMLTIERPSNHKVSIVLDSEDHTMEVCAHGNVTSSMSQLVMDNICKTLVSVTNRNQMKKSRRSGNKVNRTRRGSDGIVKVAQIDEQHQRDCLQQGKDEKRMKKQQIDRCKIRLRELRKFATSPKYQKVWHNNNSLDLTTSDLTKPLMVSLLKVFHVDGRTKISQGTKDSIRTVLENIQITQSSLEAIEEKLLEELRQLGVEDVFRLNQADETELSFTSNESSDEELVFDNEINTEVENTDGNNSNTETDGAEMVDDLSSQSSDTQPPQTTSHHTRNKKSKRSQSKSIEQAPRPRRNRQAPNRFR